MAVNHNAGSMTRAIFPTPCASPKIERGRPHLLIALDLDGVVFELHARPYTLVTAFAPHAYLQHPAVLQ